MKRAEWGEDFLDEMMQEVRDAVLAVSRASRKAERSQLVTLRSLRNTVTIEVTATRRGPLDSTGVDS